jgi:non-specific serine/threonine protein kinase
MPAGSAGLHNVPTQLTRYFGPGDAAGTVRALFNRTRLVTLTGAGGSGKTRLATEAVVGLVDDHPDGIWFVELAALVDGKLVEQQLANVLGVTEQSGQSLLAALVDVLVDRRCLLVLDNCEHLVDSSATLVDSLLHACPEVRVLTTSREPLGVPGEVTWRVPSLEVPPAVSIRSREQLVDVPSVSLFLDRAQAADAIFELTDANAADVAGICVRLAGIPLAIELAAARVPLLTPREICLRLDDCLDLLRRIRGTTVGRHQTIRATIDWSYELLEEDERAMLARLSVFVGGFRMQAAEALWAAAGHTTSALDVVGRLLNRSMLHRRVDRDRFEMLEPIRQYARERLVAAGELDDACARHLDSCLALAREVEPSMRTADSASSLQVLDEERGNIRAALAWGLDHEPDRALELATAAGGFWYLRGHLAEGCSWLRRGLAHATDVTIRMQALNLLGWLALRTGDLDAAEAALHECLALESRAGDRWAAEVRSNLGLLACWRGDLEGARRGFEESAALSRQLGDEYSLAQAMFLSSVLDYLTGGRKASPEQLDESLEIMERLGDRPGIAFARGLRGSVAIDMGDLAGAADNLRVALRITRDLGDTVNVLFGLDAFALLAAAERHHRHVLRLAGASAALREAVGTMAFNLWQARVDAASDVASRIIGPAAAAAALDEGRQLSLAEAIELALDGPEMERSSGADLRNGLSRREWEVAQLVATGLTSGEIARRLNIGVRTVETHLSSVMNKLGLNSRTLVAAWVLERRLSPQA